MSPRKASVGVAPQVETPAVAEGFVVSIPPEAVLGQAKQKHGLSELRDAVTGLMAVGASLGEGLRAFVGKAHLRDLIALSGQLASNGVAQMRALYEAQKDIKGKKAFGQACLEAGFSPVGVALAAVSEARSMKTKEEEAEAIKLVKAYGVDVWMLDCISQNCGVITFGSEVVAKMTASKVFLPCHVWFKPNTESEAVVVPWLAEVGGNLHMPGIYNVAFPALTAVAGDFSCANSMLVDLPALACVGGRLMHVNEKMNNLPKLASVGGVSRETQVEAAAKTISGLIAVGVAPNEAFSSYPNRLPVQCLVDMAFQLVQDKFKLVKTLLCILDSTENPVKELPAFAEMLRSKHGLNPLSVAMAAENEFKAKYYAHVMGIPAGLVEEIYVLPHDEDEEAVLGIELQAEKHCMKRWLGSELRGDLVLPVLVFKGDFSKIPVNTGEIEVRRFVAVKTRELSLPGLKRVAEDVYMEGAVGANLDGLQVIGRKFDNHFTENLSLESLERVGGAFDSEKSWHLSAPRLREIGGHFYSGRSEHMDLSALRVVNGQPHPGVWRAE